MLTAAGWCALAASTLVLGSLIALVVRVPVRVIALVMGFGAGVLISAVAFELTEEAVALGGTDAFVLGIGAGAVTFWAGKRLLDRATSGANTGMPIVLGAALDGVPESMAIGVGIASGGHVSAALVAAVLMSNLPESIGATHDLRTAGHSPVQVLGIWSAIVVVSTIAGIAGFALLADTAGNLGGFIQAFAGGAVLTMVTDTMIPEAFGEEGNEVGLACVLGFAVAYLIGA